MSKPNKKQATFKHPSKQRLIKLAETLKKRLDEHPKCGVTQRHLTKVNAQLSTNKHWQEDYA